ncbi:lysozyme inhibitor LprI family protein [Sphingosinicella sp.]|uniref:lysozyme inhibitor LprI family protein n=1 Tax=Sphingosinicella sp. TaxID=1917971 RepID=UPI004037A632
MTMTLLLALAFQVSTPALDAEAREHNCNDPQNQMDMNFCAQIDFERADLELNQVWRETMSGAQTADRARSPGERRSDTRPGYEMVLRAAQRAWITFRDQHCTWQGYQEARGGSMEPMSYSACRATVTRQRIEQLGGRQQEQ